MPGDVGTGSEEPKPIPSIYNREEFTCLACGESYTLTEADKLDYVRMRMLHPSIVCNTCATLEVRGLDQKTQDKLIALLGSPAGREALWNSDNYEETIADLKAKAERRRELEKKEISELTVAEVAERYEGWGEEIGKLAGEYRERMSTQP